jgi:hypothetical protein
MIGLDTNLLLRLLALQLRFPFKVGAARFGLMGAAPE